MKDAIASVVVLGMVVGALIKAQWETWRLNRLQRRAEREQREREEAAAEAQRLVLAEVIRFSDLKRDKRAS